MKLDTNCRAGIGSVPLGWRLKSTPQQFLPDHAPYNSRALASAGEGLSRGRLSLRPIGRKPPRLRQTRGTSACRHSHLQGGSGFHHQEQPEDCRDFQRSGFRFAEGGGSNRDNPRPKPTLRGLIELSCITPSRARHTQKACSVGPSR